ncbi:GNAT family N-acetyltransferase [Streptacidiphilus sp. P02-A3a]|uniref:GNAT family N-acetyltransferase n=1 Tax=Streptacidiphilus sp. P02-A3a TaxID=2704468 RepID=UPI0015FD409B|nr:GNAT family N-acetyltransferase [Streptacidiphilus sp. P02-A3a]QMU70699.1 N-acetyltransferase [Streptacidiphilus sp. P02-A3a]
MSDLLERVTAFRAAFARRQAAEIVELPGAFAVRDPDFSRSQEHNQLIVETPDADPAALPGLAVRGLGTRRQYRITVLDEALGARATPVLAAAGYSRDTELVLARETAGCAPPEPAAHQVELAELRTAVFRQQLEWSPNEDLARELTERRTARLRGAEKVLFLATRTPDGEIAAWTDLYLDPVAGLAQLEDLVTATPHHRQGHGDTLLATGLALAAAAGIPWLFLTADLEDWPREWYARRGFTRLGLSHSFLHR